MADEIQGKLFVLLVLVLLVLAVFFTVRAIRARKAKLAIGRGWYVNRYDITDGNSGGHTVIRLAHFNHNGRIEAMVLFDDPDYSNKVIEAMAAAQAMADDRNTTDRALSAGG